MTESEWLECEDPKAMLSFLQERDHLSERKARLFSVACCRSIWGWMAKEASRRLVEVVERLADSEATTEEVEVTWRDASTNNADGSTGSADAAAWGTAFQAVRGNSIKIIATITMSNATNWDAGERSLAGLLRCIFGNPFRPQSPLSPSVLEWQGSLVVRLAEAAYEHRQLPGGHLDPDRLAVLSDALEEASCDDDDLLGHLRSPGPHVRGCWAIDLLLDKK